MPAPRRNVFSGVLLSDRLGDRDNNFDLLRLLAAWGVRRVTEAASAVTWERAAARRVAA